MSLTIPRPIPEALQLPAAAKGGGSPFRCEESTGHGRSPAPKDSFDQRGDPSRLLRYVSNVPIIGGIIETVYGIQELRHAKTHVAKVNGAVDLALGIGGTLNNLASGPMYLNMITKMNVHLLQIAGPIAGVAGCITSVIDGGRDIYNGIRDHDATEKRMGGIKILAGAVSAAGAFAAMPIVMMAGTAIYAGAVAWQNRASIISTAKEVLHKVEKWVDHLGHNAGA